MIIYIIFFISIGVHELGHIITSKIFGINFGRIRFNILGFSNQTMVLSEYYNYQKILVFLSGPVFNFLLALISYNISVEEHNICLFMNLFLGFFNLLPIIPLDGANIILCVLSRKIDFKNVIIFCLKLSRLLLIIITFTYGLMIMIIKNITILIGIMYLWYIFLREEKIFSIYLKVNKNLKNIYHD